jgi:hypothetical protein
MRAICYVLFFWITIHLHSPSDHRPDTLVMALMLLSGGIILRIANGSNGWLHFAALGLTLGLGYLSKAVMFPLSSAFLAAALLAGGASRRALFRTTCSLLLFLLVSGPFVLSLSRSKQRFTFGDVGRLAYAENINQVRPFAFWQGETPGLGTPTHPERQIFSMPPVFEFAMPVGGSYPPWYGQSYWYDGIRPHFSLRGELYELRIAGENLEQLFLVELGTLTAGFLILLFWQQQMREVGRALARNMFIWGPAVAGIGLYSLVMIGDRYLGGLLLLLCAGLFASLKIPRVNVARNLVRAVALTVVLTLSAQAAWIVARDIFLLPRMNDAQDWYVAQALHAHGIPAGAYVADFDPGWFTIHYWAHLAQTKIVAEIPADNVNDFWQASPEVQAQALEVIARTGAKAVVARNVPAAFRSRGWTPVPRSAYSIRLLRSLSAAIFQAPDRARLR